METILAIETSVPSASIALYHKGEMSEHRFESHRQQNQLLFEPLQQILENLGEDTIDTILIGTGPGSYSGSRIAIAAAHGLAIVHNAKLAGISSFFGTELTRSQPCVAVGDARRGSYFYYPTDLNDPLPSPTLLNLEEFTQTLAELDASLPRFTFETRTEIPLENVEVLTPTAAHLIEYWNALDTSMQQSLTEQVLEPLYLRAPFITKSTKSHPLLGK